MSIEEIPVIDISCQSLTESAASSLLRACNEFGFFFIRNHGLSKELYQKLISGADQLFSSPEETKQKLTMGASSYTPRFVVSPFFESFKVSGPNFSASAAAQGFTQSLFGHQATEFSNLLDEYGSKMKEVSKRVVKLLLNILGDNIEDKFYDSEFSNCNAYLRINGFTPRSMNEEEEEEEELEVFKKHTDLSYVTIVFQNDIRGLQMRLKGGDWMDVRPRPSEDDNLMVNIGDFMEAWSNGRLRSAVHRVVLRKNNMKRFSMAFFLTTEDDDKEIYAPSEIVGEGKSRLYRPFSTQQYRLFKEKSGVNARYALKDIIGT
ncbi:gibberellin 20-oxidase-like protein isoform X1 [Cucurbita moschata]|uniref:Gibberellin 20-oxidase-like protein isoform X1 n=1 Tax=Cucurbita moschata TaxID=3662 RepID=A0A6J1GMS4_CUCMO|nr:gibberellin 20-oxidase-like protein isoform X1 [Cucurbita moschata]